jgi:hypothetical protein
MLLNLQMGIDFYLLKGLQVFLMDIQCSSYDQTIQKLMSGLLLHLHILSAYVCITDFLISQS